ncbi:hypothetical protein [Lysinibacillus xylanilyticus]|uniref:hypothetical protein n=1 Tax=Lysinibacillus xylanilyticus TaxID=582475 RepID=UPI0036D79B7D
MGVELLIKEDLEVVGTELEIFALCSHVEVLQNLTSVGSYREVYHLHGKEGAFVSGIIFKNFGANSVDPAEYEEMPVMLHGTVSQYKDVRQVIIKSITPIGDRVDKNDLLAEMADTKILDELNEIIWGKKSMHAFSFDHLKPALGLEDATAGTYTERLLKILQMGVAHYPDIIQEYINNISLLSNFYLKKEGTLDNRLDMLKLKDDTLTRALLFGYKDYPEYEEFIKLHHLIMKPRGCVLEILDYNFNTHTGGGSSIQ